MNLSALRTSGTVRSIGFPSVIAFAMLVFFPRPAVGQNAIGAASTETIQAKFQQVVALRLDGEYDRAIEMLNGIIAEYSNSNEVLRRAYNHLVTVYVDNDDEADAREAARGALERFPDLAADELDFPGKVNEVYDQLRKEMFGSLVIDEPRDCRVYLNNRHVGDTPLRLDLVRIGEYELKVTKPKHEDFVSQIEIQPEATRDLSGLSLKRVRAWWYWPAWIAAAAVVVGALVILVSGGDEQPPIVNPEPLDPPPDPPDD